MIMGMPYDHGFLGIFAPNEKPKASVFVLVSLLPLHLIEDRKIPHYYTPKICHSIFFRCLIMVLSDG